MVEVMKNLQTSYNKGANRFMEQAQQNENTLENLNFLINLATITMETKDEVTMKEDPKAFNEA